MTLDQIRDEIYAGTGKITDLDPDTDTQDGGLPILTRIANEGQRQVATWIDPQTGRRIRFRRLISEMFFPSYYLSETLDDDATDTSNVILPAADVGTNDDRYNGWVLEIASEQRVIVDYTGSTRSAKVHEAFSSTPASGDSYKLYKRFWYLLPSDHAWVSEHISLPSSSDRYRSEGNFFEMLRITDLEQERDIESAARDENFAGWITKTGDPAEWYRIGNRIITDVNIDDTRYFSGEYYRLPTDMSSATDQPEVPEPFHYGIVLWGMGWVWRRRGESSKAFSLKKDFEDYMRTHRTEADVAEERSSGRMILRVKE